MRFRYAYRDQIFDLNIEREGTGYRALIDGQSFDLEILDEQPGQLSLLLNGRPLVLYWAADGNCKWISLDGCTYQIEKPAPRGAQRDRGSGERGGDAVRSPMPAQVRSLLVTEGQEVKQGQTLALLEAMKMEIRLKAPRDGRVAQLVAQEGDSVDRDQVVLKLA
jgi:acetyl/propionyl-CoA carboxylase alpha subunit